MKKNQLLIFTPLIFFLLFLIDGQLSALLKVWSNGNALTTSHLLIIAIIFSTKRLSMRYLVITTFIIGILMDSYFIGVLGINAVALPLIAYFATSISDAIHENPVTEFFSLIIFITGYEIAILIIQLIFNLANFEFVSFIGKLLAPTLLFNGLIFLLIYRPFRFIFWGKSIKKKLEL
ncbi:MULTISPECIES: rod shape-determining protein MreD [unclassified Enterococcus]|uniref:rod shape-determining protein MreD n=1 Tax=unclassified Enterococcus TaxID=2608891 RepID=UPI0015520EDF|nr:MULTISPECIES: rod shape-determining protein MreD [unclassified Enterococcus]MBS7576867.1 rod shape-determining protein MreD [Enterococcus sp. MMGLQ5-2]MBS7584274.1 rod shape-determining protein MreD [Enterococcus sp. MMGLQ5-1]NPD12130.1 rod shape-determining protein MreD [Enterococcus sp. MMGLQ5-1]NPD36702.1 rod shape-determining protein MreD [Enterococcus sp. MMGLQ5-2]